MLQILIPCAADGQTELKFVFFAERPRRDKNAPPQLANVSEEAKSYFAGAIFTKAKCENQQWSTLAKGVFTSLEQVKMMQKHDMFGKVYEFVTDGWTRSQPADMQLPAPDALAWRSTPALDELRRLSAAAQSDLNPEQIAASTSTNASNQLDDDLVGSQEIDPMSGLEEIPPVSASTTTSTLVSRANDSNLTATTPTATTMSTAKVRLKAFEIYFLQGAN